MPVDASIPLQVQQPNIMSYADVMRMKYQQQQNAMLMQQMQTQQQGLQRDQQVRNLMAQPGAMAGGMPTPQAINAMAGIDPAAAAHWAGLATEQQQRQQLIAQEQARMKQAEQDARNKRLAPLGLDVNAKWDEIDADKSMTSIDKKIAAATEYRNKMADEQAASGEISKEEADQIKSRPFNPMVLKLNLKSLGYDVNIGAPPKTGKIADVEQADAELRAGRITQEQRDAIVGQATGASEPPKTRERIVGANEIQEQWDPVKKTWTPIGGGPRFAKQVGGTGAPAEKFGPLTSIEVKDKDGTKRIIEAQQDKRSGQWVTADEKRAPIDVSGGFRTVKQQDQGGREAVLLQRGITSALDAVSDIENMAALPLKSSTGIWGMGHETVSPSFMEAPKRALLNKMTSQEDQDLQTTIKGLGRSLAGLSTGGVYVNQALVKSYDMLAAQPGDTQMTKLRKLATMRQNAENGIDAMLSNPRIGDEQKEQIKDVKTRLGEAVPYLPKDVTRYEREGKDDETFQQFAGRTGVAKGKEKESGGKQPSVTNGKGWLLHTDAKGNKAYVSPDGKQFEEVK